MDLSFLRAHFDTLASTAIDEAARRLATDRPLDTRDILLSLMLLDVSGEWERIWLEFAGPESVAIANVADPSADQGQFYWLSHQMTDHCATAIRAAPIVARMLHLEPAPASILAVCLLGDPSGAAARALTHDDNRRHGELLQQVQELFIGGNIIGLDQLLDHSYAAARMGEQKANEIGRLSQELQRLQMVLDAAESIPLCRQILALIDRDDDPHTWSIANSTLAYGLTFSPTSDYAEDIGEAIKAFKAALTVFSRGDCSGPRPRVVSG